MYISTLRLQKILRLTYGQIFVQTWAFDMIVFDLECLNGHKFEGWFEDKKDLENQQEQGILQCPVCETTSVEQKLSLISIKRSSAPSNQARQALRANQEVLAEFTEKITEYVEKNYEDVGTSFTKEALKKINHRSNDDNIVH